MLVQLRHAGADHRKADSGSSVDCAELVKKLAIDMIGYVGWGIEVNSFKNPNSPFKKAGDTLLVMWRVLGVTFFEPIWCLFRVRAFNPASQEFFATTVDRAIAQRKRGNVVGKDFLGTLIQMNEETPDELSKEMMVQIMFNIVVDGYHSVSDGMLNLLYFLAVYPDIQSKTQNEIDDVFEAKSKFTTG